MKVAAIVVAAGEGRRMGGMNKALLKIGGRPLLCYSLDVFQAVPLVGAICVVVPPRRVEYFERDFAGRWRHPKVVAWVRGGERRQDSVRAGLKAIPGNVDFIAVHDAARPFADRALFERVLDAASRTGAAVPAIPITDTIKEVGADGLVARTLDRRMLRAVQTPQVFEASILARAYEEADRAGVEATDDAALVERMGHLVAVVDGSPGNIKITAPGDLAVAWELIKRRG